VPRDGSGLCKNSRDSGKPRRYGLAPQSALGLVYGTHHESSLSGGAGGG
jgi:hypothetical protein